MIVHDSTLNLYSKHFREELFQLCKMEKYWSPLGWYEVFLTNVHGPWHMELKVWRLSIDKCTHNYCCSLTRSCPTLCDPMDCSTPSFPVPHNLPEFAQVKVHWIGDAIQPSHPLSPSSSTFNLSQHQGLFQCVGSSHQVAKVLELQLKWQSFQWLFMLDFL